VTIVYRLRMSASRPRRVFAASVVVTFAAACSGANKEPNEPKETGFISRWSVSKILGDCTAHEGTSGCPRGAMCNPPPPRVIMCPADADEVRRSEVAELRDHTCAIVPEGCESAACAVTKTPCPLEFGEELPVLAWEVKRDDQGACTAAWKVQGMPRGVPVACPFPDPKTGAAQSVITRADATAPCFADAREQTKVEVPCPAPRAP
jgi:hypothetical protein